MAAWLNHHPFAVQARLAHTTVLTYAVPVAALQPLLPPCLTLDTSADGQWGFVAVALVQTQQLRPQGLPPWLGRNFFLIGYRVFVRFRTQAGKNLRGLYILRSETDTRSMEWLGNLFTSYRYTTVDIQQATQAGRHQVTSAKAGLAIEVETVPGPGPALPPGSPFVSWQQARRFAGPLPFTFSFNAHTRQVTIVEGAREAWQPQPARVLRAQVGFVEQLGLGRLQLASAFTITNVPYHWKKGRTELWNG